MVLGSRPCTRRIAAIVPVKVENWEFIKTSEFMRNEAYAVANEDPGAHANFHVYDHAHICLHTRQIEVPGSRNACKAMFSQRNTQLIGKFAVPIRRNENMANIFLFGLRC